MITIDGSEGEGGGQILRTSITLSLCTGTAVRIANIRKNRPRKGLMRQHLTAVRAAALVGKAEVVGAEIGSTDLTFAPQGITAGEYSFDVGSAGSTTLVLQTILPALLLAQAPSSVVLEGGTHNSMAPPFDFLEHAFLPLVARMGPSFDVALTARGFYPAGGGRIRIGISPAPLGRLELLERGAIRKRSVTATVQDLPPNIAMRELATAAELLKWPREELRVEERKGTRSPGNVVTIVVESEHVTEVFTGFGEKGTRAEAVAERAATEARSYLESSMPVGPHLADQLILPLALGAGGVYRTMELTLHTRTQIDLVRRMAGAKIDVKEIGQGNVEVRVEGLKLRPLR